MSSAGAGERSGSRPVTSDAGEVLEVVRQVAVEFPPSLLRALANAIEHAVPSKAGLVEAAVQEALPQAHYRAAALQLVAAWRAQAPDLSPQSLAFALLAAGRCEEYARSNQMIEPVWTGPDIETIPPRRTDQALLQVIESAKTNLTVVSFVAYKVPTVGAALAAAARRGVFVRLVIEDPETSQGRLAFDALRAFGADVAASSVVYVWPIDQRPRDAQGNHGSLHAKCAVAD